MPAVTGQEIATDAFGELNVWLPGEAIPASDGAKFLRVLNDLLDEVSNRAGFIPIIQRTSPLALVAGQGGPSNPYTVGPGGNFNLTQRPPNQNSIVAANLILTVSIPNVRVPLAPYTDMSYDSNAIPDLANVQPTGFYYNPFYTNDLGALFLWPVPTVTTNTLELFIQQSVAQFADLSTTYYVPSGWKAMLKYNVADRLQTPYGKQLAPASARLAVSTMGTVKRTNWSKLSDLMNDVGFTSNRQTYYNILTGYGGA